MHACGLGYALALVVGLLVGGTVGAVALAACCVAAIEDERAERDARFAGDARRAP